MNTALNSYAALFYLDTFQNFRENGQVYSLLDASKAFDCKHYGKLFNISIGLEFFIQLPAFVICDLLIVTVDNN